jgi:hypothetical protein
MEHTQQSHARFSLPGIGSLWEIAAWIVGLTLPPLGLGFLCKPSEPWRLPIAAALTYVYVGYKWMVYSDDRPNIGGIADALFGVGDWVERLFGLKHSVPYPGSTEVLFNDALWWQAYGFSFGLFVAGVCLRFCISARNPKVAAALAAAAVSAFVIGNGKSGAAVDALRNASGQEIARARGMSDLLDEVDALPRDGEAYWIGRYLAARLGARKLGEKPPSSVEANRAREAALGDSIRMKEVADPSQSVPID